MRSLMALVVLILTGSAVAADSSSFQLRDASDLVRVCRVDPNDPYLTNALGFCHGVLVGAFHYYASVVKGADRFVCAPNPPTTRTRVMNDFVVWADAHPAYMKDPAVDTLFRYLEETYPCKK
jgi:hypothetical protein